jgi:hypothetical protein
MYENNLLSPRGFKKVIFSFHAALEKAIKLVKRAYGNQ